MYRSDIFHGILPFDECTLQGYGPAYMAIVALSASTRQSMTYLDGREARWVCLNAFGRLCPRSSIRIGMPWAPFQSSLVCLSSKAAQAWQPCHVILPWLAGAARARNVSTLFTRKEGTSAHGP